ncbi:MAG: hypothetical protein EBR26_01200 [Microbacteriaceae bacterium]|nr:hypothetical protein [Microbacteriaceae bacterium]
MKFINDSGETIGSTELGRLILQAATADERFTSGARNWRKEYLQYFRDVAQKEHQSSRSAIEIANRGLNAFEKHIATDSGELLIDAVSNAWRNSKDQVALVIVRGTGQVKKEKIEADAYVAERLAEKGVSEAAKNFDISKIDEDLLIALAGGAEYSPARTWLDWGGSVAIVARPRVELWQELIQRARNSAGTLYVPVLKSKLNSLEAQNLSDDELAQVAGLDLVVDYAAIAGWLSMIARTDNRRIVLGSYAYAPGVKHIEAQAVQHCLARILTESLPKSRVVLTWLATPTDYYVVPKEFVTDIDVRFAKRTAPVKLRDRTFGVSKNLLNEFKDESGRELAVVDSTSSLQGPSYALAKRVQRWLAYQQVFADRQVAYLVSPPARTDSVLSVRILRATYAGSPKFGLVPFEVKEAVDLSAALLLNVLQHPRRWTPMSCYLDLAVHGGLWRLIYRPQSAWRASTLRGIFGYFK